MQDPNPIKNLCSTCGKIDAVRNKCICNVPFCSIECLNLNITHNEYCDRKVSKIMNKYEFQKKMGIADNQKLPNIGGEPFLIFPPIKGNLPHGIYKINDYLDLVISAIPLINDNQKTGIIIKLFDAPRIIFNELTDEQRDCLFNFFGSEKH